MVKKNRKTLIIEEILIIYEKCADEKTRGPRGRPNKIK